MRVQCKICEKEFDIGRLQIHVDKVHGANIEDYYTQHMNPSIDKKCPMCEKQRKFIGFKNGYAITCCNSTCKAKYINETYKEKHKEGCLERNKKWKEEIIDGKTRQQIIIESGNELRKEKQAETSIKISNALKEKGSDGLSTQERNFLKNHNVTNPMKLPEVVLKLRDTFQRNHGVDWMTKAEPVKQKIKDIKELNNEQRRVQNSIDGNHQIL